MKEFTAMTQSAKGGTQAVTVKAPDAVTARKTLYQLGYFRVLWVL